MDRLGLAGRLAAAFIHSKLTPLVIVASTALGALAVIALRRSEPNAVRPFRVPGYPVTPLLFVVAAGALVVNTIQTQIGRAAVGLGFVALGAPVYFAWRSRAQRSASRDAAPASTS